MVAAFAVGYLRHKVPQQQQQKAEQKLRAAPGLQINRAPLSVAMPPSEAAEVALTSCSPD